LYEAALVRSKIMHSSRRSGYRRKSSKKTARTSRSGRSRRNSTGSVARHRINGAQEKQDMQDLNTRLGAFLNNTKDKARRCDELQGELDRMRRDYEDRLAAAEDDAANARAQLSDMRRDLDDARREADAARAAANDARSQNDDELARLKRELADSQRGAADNERRLREEFQKKLDDWISEKRKQDQKDKSEWMNIFNEQNKNIKAYKDANATLRREKEDIARQNDALNAENRQLKDKYAESQEQIDELKRSQVTLRAEIDKYSALLNEAADVAPSNRGTSRAESSGGSKRTNYLFEKTSNSRYKMQAFYDGKTKSTPATSARSPTVGASQARSSPESRATSSRRRAASASRATSGGRSRSSAAGSSQRTNYLFEKRSDGRYEMEAFYGNSPKSNAKSSKSKSRATSYKSGGTRGGGAYTASRSAPYSSGYQSNGSRRTKSYVSSRRSSQARSASKSRSNYPPRSTF